MHTSGEGLAGGPERRPASSGFSGGVVYSALPVFCTYTLRMRLLMLFSRVARSCGKQRHESKAGHQSQADGHALPFLSSLFSLSQDKRITPPSPARLLILLPIFPFQLLADTRRTRITQISYSAFSSFVQIMRSLPSHMVISCLMRSRDR